MNYYNELDPHAAAWLRELIKQGLIPNGDVDERSICDVAPADLAGYTQCHFFAGIGGWSYALELAGWPANEPVWTGSCPCQPFSAAGKGEGQKDERHLWPELFRLIRQCRPELVFGEQVANAVGHGWLDGVSTDLESEDYVCGAAVLGAHSVLAPHIRQRLWWVAHARRSSDGERSESNPCVGAQAMPEGEARQWQRGRSDVRCSSEPRALAITQGERSNGRSDAAEPTGRSIVETGGWLDESVQQRLERHTRHGDDGNQSRRICAGEARSTPEAGSACRLGDASLSEETRLGQQREQLSGSAAWGNFEFIPCADGKARRIESGTFPLAHGVPGRVGLPRGYGNAIVPQVAAEFISAFCESLK